MDFYYSEGNQQKGPVSLDQLRALRLTPDTLVWREGMPQWMAAGAVPELANLFAPPAAPSPQMAPGPQIASAPYGAPVQQQGLPPQQAGYPAAYPQQFPQQPGYPQQMGYAQPAGYGQYGAPVNNAGQGLGITSMILGILALPLTCANGIGIIFAIVAVILGHIGHAQSRRANGQANGMAVAGLVCGYIALGIVVLAVIFVLVVLGGYSHLRRF